MATFQNIYYKRAVATAKACYMCFRPTTTVLATLNATDFLYTCDAHLTDRGFATLIEAPSSNEAVEAQAKKVSDEAIRRVKEEWEARQRRKQENTKEDKNTEGSKDKEKDKEKDSENASASSPKQLPPPSPIPVPDSTATAKPMHQRYSLHREVWAMRLAEHKKKRQAATMKEVAPRLPITPRGGVA